MGLHGGMNGLLAAHVVVLSAFVGWLIVGRAPAILYPSLVSGCAFINGIVTTAGLYILLNASTSAEQIAGFCAVLFGAANAVGGYGVSVYSFAAFRAPSPRTLISDGAASKRAAAKPERARRSRAKARRSKKA